MLSGDVYEHIEPQKFTLKRTPRFVITILLSEQAAYADSRMARVYISIGSRNHAVPYWRIMLSAWECQSCSCVP